MVKNKVLVDVYPKIANEGTLLGFKGDIRDLDVKVAKMQQVIDDKEKHLSEMSQTNEMSSTGRLSKIKNVVQIANAAAITKAGKKQFI